jgi:hypothetical protein
MIGSCEESSRDVVQPGASGVRTINSEVAQQSQLDGKGRPPVVVRSWTVGVSLERTVRP